MIYHDDMINERSKGIPWKELLNLFYQIPSGISQELNNEDEFIESWSRNINYPSFITGMAIYYLEKQKLIKIIRTKKKSKKKIEFKIELEPKGFEVAMNNDNQKKALELQKQQTKTNKTLSEATIMVAVSTALSVFIGLFTFFLDFLENSTGKGFLLIVIGLFIGLLTGILVVSISGFVFDFYKRKFN